MRFAEKETGSSSLLQIWSHFNGFISNKKQPITFRLLLYWTLLCTAPTAKHTHTNTQIHKTVQHHAAESKNTQLTDFSFNITSLILWETWWQNHIRLCCLLSGSVLQSGPLDTEATRAKRSRTVLEERGIRSRPPGGGNTWSLIRFCSDPETFTNSSRAQRRSISLTGRHHSFL